MTATRPPPTPRPRDPGLQAERTALAWNRTGLAVIVNALLSLRAGWVSDGVAVTALALLLLLAAGAIFLYGGWRRRHLFDAAGRLTVPTLAVGMVALVTLLACGTGLASLLP
jgi:uncharacterized membrane protein YidH (DUF202 family)